MTLILDNSAAMPFVNEDEADERSQALLDRILDEGAFVPPLFYAEFANALLNAGRRRRLTGEEQQRALETMGRLPLEIDDLDPTSSALLFLGERLRLTVYDAWYLYLAISRRLPLATRDEALRAAAKSVGVELVDA